MALVQIYVRLLGEGTDVWCPVSATHERPGVYRMVSTNLDPDDELWEFVAAILCDAKSVRSVARVPHSPLYPKLKSAYIDSGSYENRA